MKYTVTWWLHWTYFDLSPSKLSGFAKMDFPSPAVEMAKEAGGMFMCNHGGCDSVLGRCTQGD